MHRMMPGFIHHYVSSRSKVIFRVFRRSFSRSVACTAEPEIGHQESITLKSLVGRDFLNLQHLRPDEIKQILWTAKDLKTRMKDNDEVFQPLKGKTAAMIFDRNSTRTRLSAELGLSRLGGHAVCLGPESINLGVNDCVKDTARVLSGLADVILVRNSKQEVLNITADEATVPVINGMSDLMHPLQVLAIFMTIQEHFGYLRGSRIAWIGVGNNILHSLMHGCARLGIDLSIATPPGYEPDADVTIDAIKIAGKTGASFQMGNNPLEAVYRADAIIADTWNRTGKSTEKEKQRLTDFQGYQVNRKMLKEAGGSWVLLHCLPRQPEEVTDDLFYGEESLVWQQAENRMWTIMGLMLNVLQMYTPSIPMPKYVRG